MSKNVAPIKPSEVRGKISQSIPPQVIEVFNDLIVSNFSSGSAAVFQEDVMERLEKQGMNRQEIFNKRWLDVEELFEQNGWNVEYDKPGYNESYRPVFIFKKKS